MSESEKPGEMTPAQALAHLQGCEYEYPKTEEALITIGRALAEHDGERAAIQALREELHRERRTAADILSRVRGEERARTAAAESESERLRGELAEAREQSNRWMACARKSWPLLKAMSDGMVCSMRGV
jgi:hypothetical protein